MTEPGELILVKSFMFPSKQANKSSQITISQLSMSNYNSISSSSYTYACVPEANSGDDV